MEAVYLLLGSNLGKRVKQLSTAREKLLEKAGKLKHSSLIYETEAWGGYSDAPYLNQVLLIDTPLSPAYMLSCILEIEKSMGREERLKWADREIDIDILFYGKQIIDTPSLSIPHPYIQARRFTLAPLCEIAPDFMHPVLNLSLDELLRKCPDKSKVLEFTTERA